MPAEPSGPLGDALRAWRQRVTPADLDLPTFDDRRRVAGLRREELAMLAGVSNSYYTRLEQGRSRNASPEILDALARALGLDPAERSHLHDLAAGGRRRTVPRRPPPEHVDPALRQLVGALRTTPAIVLGRRTDVLAWNAAGHELLCSGADPASAADPRERPNMAELVFLDAGQRELYLDWPLKARAVVGNLRVVAGQHPDDPLLTSLVGRLCTRSTDFAKLWADHRVQPCATAAYRLRHPLLGEVEVIQQSLRSLAAPDQVLVTCTAAPGSPSDQSLELLTELVGATGHAAGSPIRPAAEKPNRRS